MLVPVPVLALAVALGPLASERLVDGPELVVAIAPEPLLEPVPARIMPSGR